METTKKKKQIGIYSALFIALGSTIGTGIFATYGNTLVAAKSALIMVIGWIIAGLITIPTLMVQSEMISAYPEAGGAYIFFKKARLKPAAFMYGWCYGIWGWPISTAFKAVVAYEFLDMFFFNSINIWLLKLLAVSTILIFGAINYFSLKWGAITNNVFTIMRVVLLFVISICVFTSFKSSNFEITVAKQLAENQSQFQLWMKGLVWSIALSLWSYNGINNIAYMANEVKNPRKTVPIVMLLTITITIAIYVFFVVAMSGLFKVQEAIAIPNRDFITKVAIEKNMTPWVATFFKVIVVLLCLGSVFTATKYAPRLPYAMAKDQLFFHNFAKISAKGNTPYMAVLFNTIFAAIIVLLPFMRFHNTDFIVSYFTFGASLMNLFIVLTIIPCWKNDDYNPTYKMRWPVTTLILAIIAMIIAAGSGFVMAFTFNGKWYLIFAPLTCLTTMISAYPVYHLWKKYYQPIPVS